MSGPTAMLIDGGRLHLQHGPIDLIIGVDGGDRRAVFAAATARFGTVLEELVAELPLLKADFRGCLEGPGGSIAQRMAKAVRPHARGFVTMMAAVAGAVADAVLAAMMRAGPFTRAYVNNGGDIALFLGDGQIYRSAIATLDGRDIGRIVISAQDDMRGIATSGQGGRSLSFGIAESVTVAARDAAAADVAATLIANAVDLGDHPAIDRCAANALQPDSDLGMRKVVRRVGALTAAEIAQALSAGAIVAHDMMNRNLIAGAVLVLRGEQRIIGASRMMTNLFPQQKKVIHA